MKKAVFTLLAISSLLFLTSCGARSKYNTFKEQAIRDDSNPIMQTAWNTEPPKDMRPFTYDGEAYNIQLYMDDPAYNKLGFSPYRNNAAIYRNYYKQRCESWKTLWGGLIERKQYRGRK